MQRTVTGVVEGLADEAALIKICKTVGLNTGPIHGKRGKGYLDKNIHGYNQAAKYSKWVVLRDLNHDAHCPPELLGRLLANPSRGMTVRIAVREIESWFLGDSERFAIFFGVSKTKVPADPESLEYPKKKVIQLAEKSRKKDIRSDLIPRSRSISSEGPAYASRMAEFATNHWRPRVASRQCESLRRCIDRLSAILRN